MARTSTSRAVGEAAGRDLLAAAVADPDRDRPLGVELGAVGFGRGGGLGVQRAVEQRDRPRRPGRRSALLRAAPRPARRGASRLSSNGAWARTAVTRVSGSGRQLSARRSASLGRRRRRPGRWRRAERFAGPARSRVARPRAARAPGSAVGHRQRRRRTRTARIRRAGPEPRFFAAQSPPRAACRSRPSCVVIGQRELRRARSALRGFRFRRGGWSAAATGRASASRSTGRRTWPPSGW